MIRTETVCICDGCGFREKARPQGAHRNETIYTFPDGWLVGAANPDVHFCPHCKQVLKRLASEKKARCESIE